MPAEEDKAEEDKRKVLFFIKVYDEEKKDYMLKTFYCFDAEQPLYKIIEQVAPILELKDLKD